MMPSVVLRSVARRGSSIVPRRNFSSSPSTTNEYKWGVLYVTSLVSGYGTAFWYVGDLQKRKEEQRREAWIKEHGDDIEFKVLLGLPFFVVIFLIRLNLRDVLDLCYPYPWKASQDIPLG